MRTYTYRRIYGEREKRGGRTRTSRSSWIGISKSSEKRLRLPADQRREAVPVSMDQKASSKIAANAQNLQRPLAKGGESEVSFFENDDDGIECIAAVGVDIGRASSSLISITGRHGRNE